MSLNVLLRIIRSKCRCLKDLIDLNEDEIDLNINECILVVTHVSHWTILKAFSSFTSSMNSNLISWLIISDWQWSKQRWNFQEVRNINAVSKVLILRWYFLIRQNWHKSRHDQMKCIRWCKIQNALRAQIWACL
jgi:hypothetical protein